MNTNTLTITPLRPRQIVFADIILTLGPDHCFALNSNEVYTAELYLFPKHVAHSNTVESVESRSGKQDFGWLEQLLDSVRFDKTAIVSTMCVSPLSGKQDYGGRCVWPRYQFPSRSTRRN